MRDAVPPCGTTGGGGGAGTSPAAARAVPDARPADPAAPSAPPTAPGGDSGGPSRPAPAPQRPQRPLLIRLMRGGRRNDPPGAPFPAPVRPPRRGAARAAPKNGNTEAHGAHGVRSGWSGAGACPNLPQRRFTAGSTTGRSAEYQRFPLGAPARWGPLQQIRTNRAATGPREERRGSGCALVERLRAVAPGETRDEAAPSNQLPRAADDEDHDADPAPEHPRRPGEKNSPRSMGADHHHIAPPEKRADAR